MKDKKVLIVYLSRTHNTEAVAEIIHEEVGGKLVELELKTTYPENYEAIVVQVDQENETGYLPPLQTEIDRIETYDVVFIGFPTWDMQLPPPMKSFLNQYDVSGKTVVPFNTNGGYGLGNSIRQIEDLCHEGNILEAFSTRGGLERDGIYLLIERERREEVRAEVMQWLREIKKALVHLYAYAGFPRSIRGLVTVSVLSSIGGVEPMLRSHLTICLNVGLKPEQLHHFVSVIKSTLGKKEAQSAQKVLDEMLRVWDEITGIDDAILCINEA